jgi:23S rRNA pseudouridine2605 synthase
LTAEQLEASRSERMRQNGRGQLTLEDARTWMEETGLCLFLPRRQFSTFVAPTFVEAVAGERNPAPGAKLIALAEDLLIRLETEGVVVRLNLLGQPGEQPDFVVAAWVLPYVYALRGDRDWRRSPQLTGSRQVSPLAIQTYKLLEAGDASIPQLKHALGREVTESAVLRAITELWQQLRIIPVLSAAGKPAHWQLLRLRFQKAIAEGASTSQVTAISVLASIYLQAVIAATMEEVELFLASLTARSKVREVLRGLVATRQVHTISLGHAPHFYVAGTLPEFAAAPTIYASSSMPASTNFLRSYEHNEDTRERFSSPPTPAIFYTPAATRRPVEPAPQIAAEHVAPPIEKPAESPAQFSRPTARSHDRKPSQASSNGRVTRHAGRTVRGQAARSNGTSRRTPAARWTNGTAKNGHAKHNGAHAGKTSSNGSRLIKNGNSHASRATNGSSSIRKTKPSAARTLRNGHSPAAKAAAKPAARRPNTARKETRTTARNARGGRKPALAAASKAGNRARYGFTAPPRQRTKKRG